MSRCSSCTSNNSSSRTCKHAYRGASAHLLESAKQRLSARLGSAACSAAGWRAVTGTYAHACLERPCTCCVAVTFNTSTHTPSPLLPPHVPIMCCSASPTKTSPHSLSLLSHLTFLLLCSRFALEQELRQEGLSEEEQRAVLGELEKRESNYMRLQRQRLSADDFDPLTIIGRGAFGEVRGLCMQGEREMQGWGRLSIRRQQSEKQLEKELKQTWADTAARAAAPPAATPPEAAAMFHDSSSKCYGCACRKQPWVEAMVVQVLRSWFPSCCCLCQHVFLHSLLRPSPAPMLQVRIVRERATGKIMAMKKLKKLEMLRRGQVGRRGLGPGAGAGARHLRQLGAASCPPQPIPDHLYQCTPFMEKVIRVACMIGSPTLACGLMKPLPLLLPPAPPPPPHPSPATLPPAPPPPPPSPLPPCPQVEHVKAERNVLAEVHNPFIVKLYYSFQDEAHLYLLMEYLPGGDVMVRAEWAEGARTVCKCP